VRAWAPLTPLNSLSRRCLTLLSSSLSRVHPRNSFFFFTSGQVSKVGLEKAVFGALFRVLSSVDPGLFSPRSSRFFFFTRFTGQVRRSGFGSFPPLSSLQPFTELFSFSPPLLLRFCFIDCYRYRAGARVLPLDNVLPGLVVLCFSPPPFDFESRPPFFSALNCTEVPRTGLADRRCLVFFFSQSPIYSSL